MHAGEFSNWQKRAPPVSWQIFALEIATRLLDARAASGWNRALFVSPGWIWIRTLRVPINVGFHPEFGTTGQFDTRCAKAFESDVCELCCGSC